jgi:hypothetical protein
MKDNKWVRLLAYITGFVNPRLLLQCEHLAAENGFYGRSFPPGSDFPMRNDLRSPKSASVSAGSIWSRWPA